LHHVKSLKNKIAEYKFNPIEDCTAKDITTCKELDKDVVKELLSAPLIGNDKAKSVDGTVDFFNPI